MKSLILATDMTRQQAFFDTLKTRVIDNSLDMTVYDDRHFILQVSLSDISINIISLCNKSMVISLFDRLASSIVA